MTPFSHDPTSSFSAEKADEVRQFLAQMPQLSVHQLLPTALSAAVPLWIYEVYQRGGPTSEDWQKLTQIGQRLEVQGEYLLYRSPREGETAELFNALAQALAILAFLPGGVQFGKERFDALQLLTGLLGAERAELYLQQVCSPRRSKAETCREIE